ncbi:hypothetical protein GWI33_004359 [Rhynchophorus ferrugineus]|uniref:Uncharacterized protein n=1 Tax=Rhynchophorus ferrugineus TaxID=354439 RepID=A0A834MKQ5_RHYFE|nr:hypothetical protein GWI33_004359 [Rhynchophorus ferrugineus]
MNTVSVSFCLVFVISAVLGDYEYEHFVPHYHFEYGVHDPHTHDVKDQFEHREHDDVKGEYVLDEPDGTKRIVEYTSDSHGGFQAVVRREGHAQHPAHYGDHYEHYDGDHDGVGGTSYVGVTHWGHGSGR